jgi:tRNA-dihydrouridine synthase B
MVSGKGLCYKDKNTEKLLDILEEEKPVAFQIFGSEPEVISFAAKALEHKENVILDINMGCPVPKVVKNGEGSALLKNPDLIYDLIKAASEGSKKPVTAKIRIGWDENSINAVEVAKAIEAGGASAVAVHGRTREQYYSGKANWDIIRQVKENINIPVIGNGDVMSGQDALNLMSETGCDFVMIARGSMGSPWIFKDALALWSGFEKPEEPSLEEKISIIMKHLDYVIEAKGEYVAVREMRKHVAWYLKGIRGSADIRRAVNTVKDTITMKKLLEQVKNRTLF